MEHLILSCLESRLEEGGSIYGRFLLGPFRVGQGITVATALRRALLSELQGIAITAVEIDGAAHQYASIVGVRESALDITLNLKKVILAGRAISELPAIGYINVLGPKQVRGSDLCLPNGISCVNSNQHIATVSSHGALLMKFVISSGKGYITHHSAPAQNLKPLLLRSKDPIAGSVPSPAFVREATADIGSPLSLVARTEGRIGCMSSDSRYRRRLRRRGFLSSGSDNAVVSYVQGRRLATLFLSKKGDRASNNSTDLKQDHMTPKTSPSVRKGDCLGDIAGVVSDSCRSTLRDGEGWPSGPQRVVSLGRKTRKDMFFAALAQKLDDTVEKTRGSDYVYHQNALELKVGEEENEFLQAVGNRTLLPIDAVFMPVNSVNFALQTDEQWQQPTERVVLEIWTNGSVSPRQALHEAATCLVYMFSLFRQSPGILPFTLSMSNQSQRERDVPLGQVGSNRVWPGLARPDRLHPALSEASDALGQAGHGIESRAAVSRKRSSVWNQRKQVPVGRQGGRTDLENLNLSVPAYVALKQLRINTLHDLLICAPHDLKKMLGGNEEVSFEILAKMKEVTS